MSALAGIKANPLKTLQAAAVVALAAGAIWLWMDYRATKSDLVDAVQEVEDMELALLGEQAVRDSITSRLNEIVEAQELQRERMEALREDQIETRRVVANEMERLSAIAVETTVEETPDEAAAIIAGHVNDLFGLFDSATSSATKGD